MALHLYAVVDAEHAVPEGVGLRDGRLELVRSGDLAAVVSPIQPDVQVGEADAIAHLDVITALLATGPVAPIRFGTTAPDADAIRHEVLDAARPEYDEYLRTTSNVVEVVVTIDVDEDAALRAVITHDPGFGDSVRRPASVADRIALGQDIAAQLGTAVSQWSEDLVGPACAHADAVTPLDTPAHTSMRYALLVQRDRLADVDAELGRLPPAVAQGTVPYHVEYVGPLPPLDFPLPTTADRGDSSPWGW